MRYESREQFQGLRTADPPSAFFGCTSDDPERRDYSCTNQTHGLMLEAFGSNTIVYGVSAAFAATETNLGFLFNATFNDPGVVYIPNRQAIQALSVHVLENGSLNKVQCVPIDLSPYVTLTNN